MNPCQDLRLQTQQHSRSTPSHEVLRQLPLALFDEIEYGLVVCDAEGTICFANQAARHQLATTRLLLRRDDRLRRAAGVSGDLDAAMQLAAQRGRRSLVRLVQGADRLTVSVLPLRLHGVQAPQVLVMLGRQRACSDLGLELMATSYGLTLAERRVLAALLREATPREIAAENGVALSTVRTQIISMRAKLDTRSIEGLLLRAAELPPVASALRLAPAPMGVAAAYVKPAPTTLVAA